MTTKDQRQNADFIAELKYLTTEEGGRKTPALSGYRPQVKFDFSVMETSGQQTFLNKKIVYPGDTVLAAIKIVSVTSFANSLKVGMTFEIREGSKIVGHGKITELLNLSLKKAGI